MDITILGNNSALPNHDRFPTAQVLHVAGQNFLIDCGEGTQVRIQRHNIKIGKISKIFISHLHGDHYFGLIGLLTRLSLNQHNAPIDLYAPEMLMDIINIQLKASSTNLCFPLNFYPLSSNSSVIYEDDFVQVNCFPTDHRIECYGFSFIEKPSLRKKINTDSCSKYNIPSEHMKAIVEGNDYVTSEGIIIPNKELTYPPTSAKKYSYCADTRYSESFLDKISESDWLYHETTYLSEEKELAQIRFHSTTVDAANIALKSSSKKLLIGHFSSKYKYLDRFLEECREAFPETYLSYEGQNILI